MKPNKVCVWYEGGRRFDVDDLEQWKTLPESGVVFVMVYHDGYRYAVNGGDWYWWQDDKIEYVPSGDWGTWKRKPDIFCSSCVKKGVSVSDKEWTEIKNKANGYVLHST